MPLSTVVYVGSTCLDFWNCTIRKIEVSTTLIGKLA